MTEQRSTRKRHSELKIGAATDSGGKYGDLNQDAFLVHTFENPDSSHPQSVCHLVGVFDGHSMLGEMAAEVASKAFEDFYRKIIEETWTRGDIFIPTEDVVTSSFDYAHAKVMERYSNLPKEYYYPYNGKKWRFTLKDGAYIYIADGTNEERIIDFGTTAVIALIVDNLLVVGNSGDSQCVLGTQSERSYYLTTCHSCTNREEVRRLRNDFPSTSFTTGGHYLRAKDKGHDVVINMTRAIGHKWLTKFGVIHKPSITFRTLSKDDAYLIVASDGVWDNVTASEAVMFINDCKEEGEENPHQIANKLVKKSLEDIPCDLYKDNTTAVVVFL